MNLSPAIRARIAAIETDASHGASWLAREALRTVGACAREAAGEDAASLLDQVRSCALTLIEARPEMAPIAVWVGRLLHEVDRVAAARPDQVTLRTAIVERVTQLVTESEQAGQRVIENAVEHLPSGSVVFTASFSQTIVQACRLARQRGKLRQLLVAESLDAGGRRHGRLLAEAFAEGSVPEDSALKGRTTEGSALKGRSRAEGAEAPPDVEVIADDLAPSRVGEADVVWLGADTVLSDGAVLNGTPSLAIARAAVAAGRPVEIICESAKIAKGAVSGQEIAVSDQQSAIRSPRGRSDIIVPPGMDLIPGELICAIVTEDGVQRGGTERSGVKETVQPDAASLVAQIAERLIARQESVAIAESGTGGRICDLLTDRPGSSQWFAGGVIAYSNASKRAIIGPTTRVLDEFGAVSAEVAQALAEGVARQFGSTWGIGETGIAGPQTGRRSAKPAGLTYVAVHGPNDRRRVVEVRSGHDDRLANKQAFAIAALTALARELSDGGD